MANEERAVWKPVNYGATWQWELRVGDALVGVRLADRLESRVEVSVENPFGDRTYRASIFITTDQWRAMCALPVLGSALPTTQTAPGAGGNAPAPKPVAQWPGPLPVLAADGSIASCLCKTPHPLVCLDYLLCKAQAKASASVPAVEPKPSGELYDLRTRIGAALGLSPEDTAAVPPSELAARVDALRADHGRLIAGVQRRVGLALDLLAKSDVGAAEATLREAWMMANDALADPQTGEPVAPPERGASARARAAGWKQSDTTGNCSVLGLDGQVLLNPQPDGRVRVIVREKGDGEGVFLSAEQWATMPLRPTEAEVERARARVAELETQNADLLVAWNRTQAVVAKSLGRPEGSWPGIEGVVELAGKVTRLEADEAEGHGRDGAPRSTPQEASESAAKLDTLRHAVDIASAFLGAFAPPPPFDREALRRQLFVAALTGAGMAGHEALSAHQTEAKAAAQVNHAWAIALAGTSVYAAHTQPPGPGETTAADAVLGDASDAVVIRATSLAFERALVDIVNSPHEPSAEALRVRARKALAERHRAVARGEALCLGLFDGKLVADKVYAIGHVLCRSQMQGSPQRAGALVEEAHAACRALASWLRHEGPEPAEGGGA